ncbi:MAG: hypothetical protein WC408_04120 [Candidatus Micrarchaeia archaeon]|jgi:hypothetical protein
MANHSKKEKPSVAELEAMFKQFQGIAKREKLTRAKVIKEIKKDRAERGEKRTPRGESAWDLLSPLVGTLKGLGPFKRDKSERDLEKYCRKDGKAAPYPGIFTMLFVERAICECKDYPTRTELRRALGGSVTKKILKDVLDQLEKSNKIIYVGNRIVWIATNKKLDAAIQKGRKLH